MNGHFVSSVIEIYPLKNVIQDDWNTCGIIMSKAVTI
jgi:hypothetical protein